MTREEKLNIISEAIQLQELSSEKLGKYLDANAKDSERKSSKVGHMKKDPEKYEKAKKKISQRRNSYLKAYVKWAQKIAKE